MILCQRKCVAAGMWSKCATPPIAFFNSAPVAGVTNQSQVESVSRQTGCKIWSLVQNNKKKNLVDEYILSGHCAFMLKDCHVDFRCIIASYLTQLERERTTRE